MKPLAVELPVSSDDEFEEDNDEVSERLRHLNYEIAMRKMERGRRLSLEGANPRLTRRPSLAEMVEVPELDHLQMLGRLPEVAN